MNKLAWKPWHEVVKLRDDLRSGDLPLHMFAADLYDVIMQSGKRPVYEKPEEFFALTFPTYNLRQLARDVVLRLAGKNDKAVRQLQLTYGGGKTHTLITMRHLVSDPDSLPDLPAVNEFVETIGQKPPKCRVAALCFDKLDVEKGMEVTDPVGKKRTLKQPWSVLAYQIAGDDGLKLLNAEEKAEERETAPAENLLIELLELPVKQKLGVLILIDEVLMYAREKVALDRDWRGRLVNFFQYLTQAAVKVDRCCIVASLLATDPRKSDTLGRELQSELYDIFQRQREEAIEPVVKDDVAEVLRRRFFTPKSLKDQDAFRQHVVAALKGVSAVDETTARQGVDAEERFFKSYPFHPDLTEVLYSKWTQLARFQRTRGVLRTFALALREAESWDTSPLIGPALFLSPPKPGGKSGDVKEGMSEALRELIAVADTEEWEGKAQNWTGILDSEFGQARQIQAESNALKFREIEQAVVSTFLHSQPIGQTAKSRDLMVLLGQTRPDKIELEKGLTEWSHASYWLDDLHSAADESRLPTTWRLGNRPNLNQMHSVQSKNIPDETVKARLLDDIGKVKSLTANASALGVRVHLLPARPKDIEDDGLFHYAILGLGAASESGKPSPEAKRYLDETTGSDKPRVYRNAILLLAPSKDGIEMALARVRDFLAWDLVKDEIKKQAKDGNVDAARAQTLQINIDRSKGRITEAIKQAYCIVVTVSEKDDAHAFRIAISDDPHFDIIKGDKRSRLQDSAITAEALLPEGPYSLWRAGETSRRVKDLAGAFAQLPHLPKMLKSSAILDTLAGGCEKGTFVLRLMRPDRSIRTWWMIRPDEGSMSDPAMELVLNEAAELSEIPGGLLNPNRLPKLWEQPEISVSHVHNYFGGGYVVQVDFGSHTEPLTVPKAESSLIDNAINSAIESGQVWLRSGPASILSEPVPPGLLDDKAFLHVPPKPISPIEILPENLPNAWQAGAASGLSVATSLSHKTGETLPWKTIKEVIGAALQARFIALDTSGASWPCDFPSAGAVKFKMVQVSSGVESGSEQPKPAPTNYLIVSAEAELQPSEIQDLGDIMPKLLAMKAKLGVTMKFKLKVVLGDEANRPAEDTILVVNNLLQSVNRQLIAR